MQYLGHLSKKDPLYGYLCHDIFPQLGASGVEGIRVFGSSSSHAVYVYEDRASCVRAVGKFFAVGDSDFEHARRKMYREYDNLRKIRNYLGENHYVAEPLGCNEYINCLLVIEYCYGEPLDSVILQAIYQKKEAHLYNKLTALGHFLCTVHNRSAQAARVDFQKVCKYYNNIVAQLNSIVDKNEAQYLRDLCKNYKNDSSMYQDCEVWVHGDATPANFFFGDGMYVISFDLERMTCADRLFDVGRMAGELKHFFLFHTHNKYKAEPFIGHFLWEYCRNFPDCERAFKAITARLPFYMGQTLLRIARNNYFEYGYRRLLVNEAELTLKRG